MVPTLLSPSMRNKYSFQEPLNEEPDGTYITAGQMQFYLNREDGPEKFKTGDAEFLEYYNLCRVYNLVSDIMKLDEDAAIMYWDSTKEVVSIGFPADGEVAKALSGITPHSVIHSEEEEDDEDDYGLFNDASWNDT